MFSRPKILFLVSLLFVALLNPKFNPYLLFKFLIFYHVEVISSKICKTLPLDYVLKQLKLAQHTIHGDGSCLYHAIAHQAGFIKRASQGNPMISNHLRYLVMKTMTEHPDVRLEDGLSVIQWLEKKQKILNVSEWGGDLEIRLLAITLHREIVVLTSGIDGSYAESFPVNFPHYPR